MSDSAAASMLSLYTLEKELGVTNAELIQLREKYLCNTEETAK